VPLTAQRKAALERVCALAAVSPDYLRKMCSVYIVIMLTTAAEKENLLILVTQAPD